MRLSQTSFSSWLAGVFLALGMLSVGTLFAQDDAKPAEAEPRAEWAPKDTVQSIIKRDPETQKKGLHLYTPNTWTQGEPDNKLRLAQFKVPASAGDTEPVELTIFSFRNGAGGVQANVDRWVSQFQEAGRSKAIATGEGKQGLYVIVDLKGTYNMSVGPPIAGKKKAVPNARMLAVIIGIRWDEEVEVDKEGKKVKENVTKSAIYFLKMAGPEKTVSDNEQAFRDAFGALAADKENPLEETGKPADATDKPADN